jgi:ABC-type spermidine/putrescine transport system permease subunit I
MGKSKIASIFHRSLLGVDFIFFFPFLFLTLICVIKLVELSEQLVGRVLHAYIEAYPSTNFLWQMGRTGRIAGLPRSLCLCC